MSGKRKSNHGYNQGVLFDVVEHTQTREQLHRAARLAEGAGSDVQPPPVAPATPGGTGRKCQRCGVELEGKGKFCIPCYKLGIGVCKQPFCDEKPGHGSEYCPTHSKNREM